MSANEHLGPQFALYHGTRPENVESIRNEGLRPPAGTGPGWPMLTADREQATHYSRGAVLEYHVPAHEVWKSGNDKASLWPAQPHSAYIDRDADAHAIRTTLPGKYLAAVHDHPEKR